MNPKERSMVLHQSINQLRAVSHMLKRSTIGVHLHLTTFFQVYGDCPIEAAYTPTQITYERYEDE